MPTPLANIIFSLTYDPYEPEPELLAHTAAVIGFRTAAHAAGLQLLDDSDRDLSYRVEVATEKPALALLEALLSAGITVDMEAERGDAKAVARVNAIYVAHGRPGNFDIDRGPSQAEQAAVAADLANLALLREALARLEETGLVRAYTDKGLGWADMTAIHPSVGQNPRISLDKGGPSRWGYNTSWTPMLRVETPSGEQGWLCINGGLTRGPLVLDSGQTFERIGWPGRGPELTRLILKPIDFPRPAWAGAPRQHTLTLPLTIEMRASASQSEAEVALALHAVLKEVLSAGMSVGAAHGATISLDGKRLRPRY